jgi:hypothetical protein
MTDMADMLEALAAAIEKRGIANANETFVLNLAQREWISTSLRHEATRLRLKRKKPPAPDGARGSQRV